MALTVTQRIALEDNATLQRRMTTAVKIEAGKILNGFVTVASMQATKPDGLAEPPAFESNMKAVAQKANSGAQSVIDCIKSRMYAESVFDTKLENVTDAELENIAHWSFYPAIVEQAASRL